MRGDGRLYRGSKAVCGGVCSGIAAYFGADSLVVRILTVMLAIVTCGFALVVYVLLWMILPRVRVRNEPYDVTPAEAHSETYGVFDPEKVSDAKEARVAAAAQARTNLRSHFVGVGHLPPEPPKTHMR